MQHCLAITQPWATCMERIWIALFNVVCGAAAANHNTSNSQRGLTNSRALWFRNNETNQLAAKPKKQCEYIAVHFITIGTIAVVMRKGWDNMSEVEGQGSFTSTNACCLSPVASVYKVLSWATKTLMSWRLWPGLCISHVCTGCNTKFCVNTKASSQYIYQ